ncbi:hypothetical protein M0802_016231, partial [Mischocyttarus mexicanus]
RSGAGRLTPAETSVSHVESVRKSGRCSHSRLTPPPPPTLIPPWEKNVLMLQSCTCAWLDPTVRKECGDAAVLHVWRDSSHGKEGMC